MITNEKGHTLIEMVIVLMFLTVLIALPLSPFTTLTEKQTTTHFLRQLEQDLYAGQQKTLSDENIVQLSFFNESYRIKVGSQLFIERKIPEQITIEGLTMSPQNIYFYSNGTINKSGKIAIKTEENTYRLVFLLGKGRFYIDQIS